MGRKTLGVAGCLAATALAMASLVVLSSSADANSSNGAMNGTTHCNPGDPACGANPVLTGPAPPFVVFSGNCPSFLTSTTDTWALDFTSGNSVSHGTTNKNGD